MKVAANGLASVVAAMRAMHPPPSGPHFGVILCPDVTGLAQGLVALRRWHGVNISVGVAIRPGREGLGR